MKDRVAILVLEDVPQDAELIRESLRAGKLSSQVKHVESRADFERELETHPPDIILSDHGLPSFDSLAALELARARHPEIPFIIVTGSTGDEMTLKALQRGVEACVSKNQLGHLVPKIKRALKSAQQAGRIAELERELAESEERFQSQKLLAEQALRKSVANQEILEAANKELEAFSYSVSHDLRAPLRHINAFIQLLEQNVGPELQLEGRKYIQTISDSAHHMGELVDGLLSFSRAGRQDLRRVRVSLNNLVVEAQEALSDEIADRNIKWVIEELPTLEGDPVTLRQAFINLIANAVKYTASRSPARIEIGSFETEDHTVCYVRDNGVGFEQQYADKLFGVFQRLHPEHEFAGTGIGLAIVRRVIQRHGGQTWAEGNVGQGATFYFSLPKSAPVQNAP